MNLRNYSYEGCTGAVPSAGWVNVTLTRPAPRYLNLEEYKRARYVNALRNGPGRFRNEHCIHALTEALISTHSPVRIQDAISRGQARRIVVIAVNARSDIDSGVGADQAVPGLLKVVSTVIGTPIDATTAYANASLQELVRELQDAGGVTQDALSSPLFHGLRVYSIPIDFDQFLPEQSLLQARVKAIGTTWTLSPQDVQAASDAGRLLLRQHPCYQRLLLDLGTPMPTELATAAQTYCPFPEPPAPARMGAEVAASRK